MYHPWSSQFPEEPLDLKRGSGVWGSIPENINSSVPWGQRANPD